MKTGHPAQSASAQPATNRLYPSCRDCRIASRELRFAWAHPAVSDRSCGVITSVVRILTPKSSNLWKYESAVGHCKAGGDLAAGANFLAKILRIPGKHYRVRNEWRNSASIRMPRRPKGLAVVDSVVFSSAVLAGSKQGPADLDFRAKTPDGSVDGRSVCDSTFERCQAVTPG